MLNLLIGQVLARKTGNREFGLFYLPDEDHWIAMVGNPVPSVYISEATPNYEAVGGTATKAVQNLLKMIPAH